MPRPFRARFFTTVYTMYILLYMKTKIQKWGNSLGVRLPKSITEQKALRAGLGVSVVVKNGQIVIEPVVEEMSLESLLETVSPDNLHREMEWSEARGNEIW